MICRQIGYSAFNFGSPITVQGESFPRIRRKGKISLRGTKAFNKGTGGAGTVLLFVATIKGIKGSKASYESSAERE